MAVVPKRAGERRRRNAYPGEAKVAAEGEVAVPRAPAGLHPIARRWYLALGESPVSQFYEATDWADALVAVTALDDWLKSESRQATKLEVWRQMAIGLLTSEASRRRVRLEIERVAAGTPKPTGIDEYRERLAR